MKFCSTVDLREKDVINVCDGARLGCPEDFEIDMECGKIIALIVVGDGSLLGFGKKDTFVIPWEKIQCVGEDAVLVKLTPEELRCSIKEKGKKPRNKQKL